MGLPSLPLSLNPALRPLAALGLEWVLGPARPVPGPSEQDAFQHQHARGPEHIGRAAPHPAGSSSGVPVADRTTPSHAPSPHASAARPSQTKQTGSPAAQVGAPSSDLESSSSTLHPPAQHLHAPTCPEPLRPVDSWSPAWAAFWTKTANRTPAIVWTYLELAQDLSGQANPDRSTLWKMLLKDFGWPKGVVSFWPMSEPGPSGFTPRPDMFWEGVRRLNPQHLACFGQEAFRALAPDADPNLHVQPYKNLVLHHLPDPKTLTLSTPTKRLHLVHSLQTLAFPG